MNSPPLLNIPIVKGMMAGAVLIFRLIIGISSFPSLIGAVLVGALLYFAVLFRIDPDLRHEAGDLLRIVGLF